MSDTRQHREQVNEAIIEALESQMVLGRSDHGFPRNILSRRRYGGIEAVVLMLACQRRGLTSCCWGTRTEWEALDGTIREGSGTEIVVGRRNLFESLHPLIVYNLCQVSGDFPVSRNERPTVDYDLVERVITNTRANIRYTDERVAEYHFPQKGNDGDFIKICRKKHFQHGPGGSPSFYHVLFHELAHWTEPGTRCGWWDTKEVNELRAEIAADFLATEFAVPDYPYRCRRNVHKHLDIWINEMRRRPRLIFKVAASAVKAVDYILGYTLRVEPRHEAIWDEAA